MDEQRQVLSHGGGRCLVSQDVATIDYALLTNHHVKSFIVDPFLLYLHHVFR